MAVAGVEQGVPERGGVVEGDVQLPAELAVSYMEELYPVVVGSVDATALFDPANERMR